MKDFYEVYEALVDNGYFTEEELSLLTNINGNTLETLEDAIYCRYGFRSYEQMTEAE
jgi:transcription initiation factor IIE alpha subunit